jgi:FAD/FMN-containing dehydrogenase
MAPTARALDDFRSALRGQALVPGDVGYDAARRIFNAMIDRYPAVIARCASAADVVTSVEFAHAEGLEVSVRGGGHNPAGKAVGEGLMIDLSPMKGIRIDPQRRVARAEAGCTLADLDRDCQRFGLATPLGVVSATGIAGLTLGGGIGWLGSLHGLACDNVLSFDIVTADGRLLTVNENEHPDLYWALRGGSGNFGVVTSFEYQLHEVGPVIGGTVLWPLSQAAPLLRFYEQFARGCPDRLSMNVAYSVAPDRTTVVGVGVAWVGPLDEGERALRLLRSFGIPLADTIQRMPFVERQRGGDPAFPFGRRHYWKAGWLRHIGDDVIGVMTDFAGRFPSPSTRISLQQVHGAAVRVSSTATAFAHREEQWDCEILGQWERPEDDERGIRWTREAYAAMEPHLERTLYVNALAGDEPERVPSAYGANYERLAAIKARYDPANFFRNTFNVSKGG